MLSDDAKLLSLIQIIQGSRIRAKGNYKGTIRQSFNSKVPSVFYTFIQKVKALDELLFHVKEYECITAWIIATDIARIRGGLSLCQHSSSLSIHGRRNALNRFYGGQIPEFGMANKPCNSQFCPFCAIRRVEALEALNIEYNKYKPYCKCYGSFAVSAMSEEAVKYSIANLSDRADKHKIICGLRKYDYSKDTNRIFLYDYILASNGASSIMGYTPIDEDPTQYEAISGRSKVDAYTMLMPCASVILQLMRLNDNVCDLLKYKQRSTFRICTTGKG